MKYKSMMGKKIFDRNYDLSKNILFFYVDFIFFVLYNIVVF